MDLKKINYGINIITDCKTQKIENIIKVLQSKFIMYSINQKNDAFINLTIKDENTKLKLIVDNKQFSKIEDIIEYMNVVPKLFLKDLTVNKYEEKLNELEHRKDIEKSKLVNKYNEILNSKLNILDGINNIYEWYTGAVYFKDYEWNEINNNNQLKKLFEKKENDSYIYSLPLDSGIILRSFKIYYYFSTDISRFEKPNIYQIKKWFKNVTDYINDVKKIMNNYKVNDNYDKRLILGVIDNLRNIILLLTNTELMILSDNGNDFIYHNSFSKNIVDEYFELIVSYQEVIENICFENFDVNLCLSTVIRIINKIDKLQKETFNHLNNITNEFILSKCFNPLREVDNYIENYMVCKYIIEKNKLSNKDFNLVSLLYGSLELPFIIKRLCNSNINISFLFQNHGMYLDRQQKDLNLINKDIKEYGTINKNQNTYIIDDNMMSGVTMQFAFNKLFVNEYKSIKGLFVIRHPNVNRIAQLEHFDVALNLELVDKYIHGLITDTPYSKIKRKTNLNNMFVNELNIFSIMTEVFLKALYCNNSFIKDSQVDIFKGYSEGRND